MMLVKITSVPALVVLINGHDSLTIFNRNDKWQKRSNVDKRNVDFEIMSRMGFIVGRWATG